MMLRKGGIAVEAAAACLTRMLLAKGLDDDAVNILKGIKGIKPISQSDDVIERALTLFLADVPSHNPPKPEIILPAFVFLSAASRTSPPVEEGVAKAREWLPKVNPLSPQLMTKVVAAVFQCSSKGLFQKAESLGIDDSRVYTLSLQYLCSALVATLAPAAPSVAALHLQSAQQMGDYCASRTPVTLFQLSILKVFADLARTVASQDILLLSPRVFALFEFRHSLSLHNADMAPFCMTPAHSVLESIAAIESHVVAFVHAVAQREISLRVAERCHFFFADRSQLLRSLSIEPPPAIFLREVISMFDNCIRTLKITDLARRWLEQTMRLPMAAVEKDDEAVVQLVRNNDRDELSNRPIASLERLAASLLCGIGSLPIDARSIAALVGDENLLFLSVVKSVAKRNLPPTVSRDDVVAALEQVREFLRRVVQRPADVPLLEFNERFQLVTEMSHDRIADDLAALCKHVHLQDLGGGVAVDVIMGALASIKYSQYIPALVNVIESLHLACSGTVAVERLRAYATRMRADSAVMDLTLSDAAALNQDVARTCGGLKDFQLAYFQYVDRPGVDQLVEFLLAQQDFESRFAILMSQVQGVEFDTKVLTNLNLARHFLRPLFSKDVPSLEDLAREIAPLIASPSALKELLCVDSTIKNFPHVQELFASVDAFAPARVVDAIRRITAFGSFRSIGAHYVPPSATLECDAVPIPVASERGILQLVLHTDEGEGVIPRDQLDDLIRGAELSKGDVPLEDRALVRGFVECYSSCSDAHMTLLRLADSGHPLFESPVAIHLSRVDDPLRAAEQAAKYRRTLVEWDEEAARLYELHPRLHFLPRSFLPLYLKYGTEPLRWALLLAFPDLEDKDIRSSDGFISNDIFEIEESDIDGDDTLGFASLFDDSPMERLQQLGEALTAFERAQLRTPPPPAVEGFGDNVILMPSACQSEIYFKLLQCFEGLPHPSCILFGSPNIPMGVVGGFLRRVEAFPHLTFAIVAPNLLSPPARDEVLRAHNVRFARSRDPIVRPPSSRLFLLFTGREGFEVMHPTPQVEEVPKEGLRTEVRRALESGSIEELRIVYSEGPRTGKSHFIASTMGLRPDVINVRMAVHEDFSSSMAVRLVGSRTLKSSEPIHLHFDLAFDRRWGVLNLLISNLLRLGIIVDEEGGGVVDLSDRAVFVSVEAPFLPVPPRDQLIALKAALFIADVVAPHRVAPSDPLVLEATGALQRVGTFLRLHATGQLAADVARTRGGRFQVDPIDAAASALAAYLGTADRRPPHRRHKGFETAFVRLMNVRCEFLLSLSTCHLSGNMTVLSQNPLAMRSLFDLFLRETNSLLDTSSALRSIPPIHIARTISDEFVCADILALHPDVAPSHIDCIESLTSDSFPANAGMLRAKVAAALGLRRTGRLRPILEGVGFVLTPAFASKLLILNERRIAGGSAVIVGDTGVGKVGLACFCTKLR